MTIRINEARALWIQDGKLLINLITMKSFANTIQSFIFNLTACDV